jgi:signal transduction histidine kinase
MMVFMAAKLRPRRRAVVGPRDQPRVRPRSDARRLRPVYGGPIERPPVIDVLIAAGLFGIAVAEVLGATLAEDVVEGSRALNLAAVALMTLPLALRRRAPAAVALVIFGAWAARALAGPPLEIYPPAIASLIAIYSVAAYASLRDAVAALGLLGLALAVAADRGSGGDAAPELLPSLILAGGVFGVGRVARVRHERALGVEHAATRRVAEERARLARELHDAVSHSLASIVMQAGGAQDVLRRDPERAETALGAIERTAREGLGEMRRLLGLLGDEDAPREPQPGLDRLDELVAGARGAGLEVDASVEGPLRRLPAGVDLSAYRIVQEALTNAMKHGGRCRARVVVRYGLDALELEIVDDGRGGAGAPGAGRGLVGMRERVVLLGGELTAGPAADGRGFQVHARLPLEPAA